MKWKKSPQKLFLDLLTFFFSIASAHSVIPDWKFIRDYLLREGTLGKAHVNQILRSATAIMSNSLNY